MKKLFNFTIILIISVSACLAQSRDVRQLGYFNKIQSGGSFNVFLKQGSKEKVIIEAASGPIDKIITEVEDNTLKIKTENENWWSGNNYHFKDVNIYVTFTELESIASSGSGNLKLESPISGNNLSIVSSGSGNVYCEDDMASSGNLRITNSGSSNIKINASASVNRDTKIVNSGSGNIFLNALAANELSIVNSGSGGLTIDRGNINEESIVLSGSGDIQLEDVASIKCTIKKSGSGTVYVNVKDQLSGASSGSGNVYVKGGQPRLDFHFSGSGKIKYLD